jgi:hypothetical protein
MSFVLLLQEVLMNEERFVKGEMRSKGEVGAQTGLYDFWAM